MWYRKAETTGRMHKGAPGKCLKWLIKSKHKTKVIITGLHQKKCVLCLVAQLCPTLWGHKLLCPWDSPGTNTRVVCHVLLQGIFPTQGSNPGLLHCRKILYQLSHQGSLRILEWVAYPFSNGSSRLGNLTCVFCIAGRFFTNWAIREALVMGRYCKHFEGNWVQVYFPLQICWLILFIKQLKYNIAPFKGVGMRMVSQVNSSCKKKSFSFDWVPSVTPHITNSSTALFLIL